MGKFDTLLQKEMSRKQFLVMLGTAIAGLFGLSSLMGLLTKSAESHDSEPTGYGDRHYGP